VVRVSRGDRQPLGCAAAAIIFLPHADDWSKTHIGSHYLVLEAMGRCSDLACRVVETEFWGAMDAPT
jgi:hypothetical protein